MITDEMATLVESIINDRLTVTTFDGYYEVDNAADVARAALTAALPMIRAAALEEAAKVADDYKRAAGNSHLVGEAHMLDAVATVIRAMKGSSNE